MRTLAHPLPPILHHSMADMCTRQPARALAWVLFLSVCVASSDDTLVTHVLKVPCWFLHVQECFGFSAHEISRAVAILEAIANAE